jgi:hypothetical protein
MRLSGVSNSLNSNSPQTTKTNGRMGVRRNGIEQASAATSNQSPQLNPPPSAVARLPTSNRKQGRVARNPGAAACILPTETVRMFPTVVRVLDLFNFGLCMVLNVRSSPIFRIFIDVSQSVQSTAGRPQRTTKHAFMYQMSKK